MEMLRKLAEDLMPFNAKDAFTKMYSSVNDEALLQQELDSTSELIGDLRRSMIEATDSKEKDKLIEQMIPARIKLEVIKSRLEEVQGLSQ
jgi:hypothetical protein